jgi:hypothetical protein
MTTTCSSVAVIENEFCFFVNKASAKNQIYTSTIQSVIEDKIVSFFMVYMLTLIARSKGGALQSLEID